MDFWQQLAAIILAPAGVIASLTYLINKVLDNRSARELQNFKHQLELQRIEFTTRFSYIHNKRAEIIGELYGLLIHATSQLSDLTSIIRIDDGRPLHQRKKEVADAFNKFAQFYSRHRIYLDNSASDIIDKILKAMQSAYIDYDVATYDDQYDYSKTTADMWKRSWDEMSIEVPPLKQALEQEFRLLLGISE